MKQFSYSDLKEFISEIYGDVVWTGPGRNIVCVPYGYTITPGSLAQNASITTNLSITANADFVLTGMAYRAGIGAAETVSNKTAAYVRVLITDSGTNEQFSNSAVDLENYAVNGHDMRELAWPRFIAGRTNLTMQFTNYAPTAETYGQLDLYLYGLLVRRYN